MFVNVFVSLRDYVRVSPLLTDKSDYITLVSRYTTLDREENYFGQGCEENCEEESTGSEEGAGEEKGTGEESCCQESSGEEGRCQESTGEEGRR